MKELEALEILEAWLNGALMAVSELQGSLLTSDHESYAFYDGKEEGLSQVLEELQFIKAGFLKENSK